MKLLKTLSLTGLLSCAVVLATAYYLEYQYMLATCPLCILQRMVFFGLAAIFLCGALLPIRGFAVYVYCIVLDIFATVGAGLAARQIWLQYFAPPSEVTCAASLQHLIDIYPLLDALKMALVGNGECATIDFTIFGLSLAAWSFLLFVGIIALSNFVLMLQKKRRI